MIACNRGIFRLNVLFLLVVFVSACNFPTDNPIKGYSEHFYSNAAQYSYIAENKKHIYYSNVYDQRRLYRWDKSNAVHELLAEYLIMSGDITVTDQDVFLVLGMFQKMKQILEISINLTLIMPVLNC